MKKHAVLILPLVLLLLSACSKHIPASSQERLPFAVTDSVFLAPVFSGEGGNFQMPNKLQKSGGDEAAYLRVWRGFLKDELSYRNAVLVLPVEDDSVAHAQFHCPMPAVEWLEIYGVVPGEGSRVLQIGEMRLEAIKRNFFERLLTALNLMDTTYEEWGYLQLEYSLYNFASESGSGMLRLVSREPDTKWVSSRMDRAGRLMVRGAKDLAQELKP